MKQRNDLASIEITNVVFFTPASGEPAVNLADFIRVGKEELTVFGSDLDWTSWRWKGVGQFLKLGCGRNEKPSELHGLHLHSSFVDFAKAYVRYEAGHWPGSRTGKTALQALRTIERALLEATGDANPCDITLAILDQAAEIARKHYGASAAYTVGTRLSAIARALDDFRVTNAYIGAWTNPIPSDARSNLGVRLGPEADEARRKRLPDIRALSAIGMVFAKEPDWNDKTILRDVYMTSGVAILMGYPSRGQEVHELETDLEIERPDLEGDLQYGHRYRSSKTAQTTSIKHVPATWAPFTKLAVQRVRRLSESARKFARYVEKQLEKQRKNPGAKLRFYRHPGCPKVGENELLSGQQVAAALGISANRWERKLAKRGLSAKDGIYTLATLWPLVLKRLPEGFPYVMGAKDKRLKYSQALFCMHRFQLDSRRPIDPLSLWMPSRDTMSSILNGTNRVESFFERYGIRSEDGEVIRLNTHQIRHLLNTLVHDGEGDTFIDAQMINYWSGRDRNWQGEIYNHVPAEKRAERARDMLKSEDGGHHVIELPKSRRSETEPTDSHWTVSRPGPRSCADIEMSHRSAVLMTAYGCCEHDWLLEPCQFHKDCLNCKEHYCVKGAGKDDQERLIRIREVLQKVIVQQDLAKKAAEDGEVGAEFWYKYQSSYRERLEQLIALLTHSAVADGSVIRLTELTSNSHIHRVLRTTAVRGVESNISISNLIEELTHAYEEAKAVGLATQTPSAQQTAEGHDA